PDIVKEIHRQYIDAGSNVITTNTFGANRYKLSHYGFEDKVGEFCSRGVELAREAAGDDNYVAAGMAPIGKLLQPLGDLTFDEAYSMYREIIQAFDRSKPDVIIMETMLDIGETRIAMTAVKENTDIPVIVSMTYDGGKRTTTGTPPEVAGVVFESLGAIAVGANCSTGPEELLFAAKKMNEVLNIPILIQSNAGNPTVKDGKTVFPLNPNEYAFHTKKIVQAGVKIVGGCCGTTPDHIRELAKELENIDVQSFETKKREKVSFLASRTKLLSIKDYPVMIGERINPNAQKKIAQGLKEGKFSYIFQEAESQANKGAEILDINVSAINVDEPKIMKQVVTDLSSIVDVPLCIDSSDYVAIREGLKYFPGKALVNSINGEKEKLEKILPLVKKYGASVIALTMDDDGIPDTVEGRFKIAERIIQECDKYEIPREDIYFDTLVLTISTNPQGAKITLDTMRKIKEAFGARTVLGLSNISYGLPGRVILNASFLSMAIEAGLDAAITNPKNDIIRNTFYSASLLCGYDRGAVRYIDSFYEEEIAHSDKKEDKKNLKQAIIKGAKEEVADLAQQELANKKPLEIINEIVIPALDIVGDKYEKGEYFLPQLLLASEAAEVATSFIKDVMDKSGEIKEEKATIVFATVKGDLHDIGKNIVISVLKNYGYKIIDLGKGVDAKSIVDTAIENNANVICLSALMTTTMQEMKVVVDMLKERGIRDKFKILIGGAVVNDEYANTIGVDAYAKDSTHTVNALRRLGV
ncbi:homocysteine S-methyltransferase family protein, partial [bacterium]